MITLVQVLEAYEYAEKHPHRYLRGTTNWCAAIAWKLNQSLNEERTLRGKVLCLESLLRQVMPCLAMSTNTQSASYMSQIEKVLNDIGSKD